jgi:Flp pilus assembly pilin Flp
MTVNAQEIIHNNFSKILVSLTGRKAFECNQGATAVEYAIILALIAAVIFAAVASLGSAVSNLFVSASKGW